MSSSFPNTSIVMLKLCGTMRDDAAHLRISLSVFPLRSDVSSISNNLVVRFSDQADNALEMSR